MHGHRKHDRPDVDRKQCIQGSTEQVERVVIKGVPDQTEPQQQSLYRSDSGAEQSNQQQRCRDDERHPVVSEPGGSNPFDVAVGRPKGQSHERLSQHDREQAVQCSAVGPHASGLAC
jgi:hypothetical protein